MIYTFPSGIYSTSQLVRDREGNLYGTTRMGGIFGAGTVFKLTARGRLFVLHAFGAPGDGMTPQAGVTMDAAGNLYGTTFYGGTSTNCAQTCGTVFKIATDGTESLLHSFTGGSDGAYPAGGLIVDGKGNLFGTTQQGGTDACDCGTVFKLAPRGKNTVLHAFTGPPDGAIPISTLARDGRGNLYGETPFGGANDSGSIFRISHTGDESVLYSFTGGKDGYEPTGGLATSADGMLYGVTNSGGGSGGFGTLFKMNRRGRLAVLHTFTGGSDGNTPSGTPLLDAAGNVFGTTQQGGNGGANCNCGTVFRVDSSGTESTLHAFNYTTESAHPVGGLVEDALGYLYGVTTGPTGSGGGGAIFRVAP